jgi:hypothetical protein
MPRVRCHYQASPDLARRLGVLDLPSPDVRVVAPVASWHLPRGCPKRHANCWRDVATPAAGVLVPMTHRLRISPVLDYLVVGAMISPYGLRLLAERWQWLFEVIADLAGMQHLAELGVIFLLFMIGLELSIDRLWSMRRPSASARCRSSSRRQSSPSSPEGSATRRPPRTTWAPVSRTRRRPSSCHSCRAAPARHRRRPLQLLDSADAGPGRVPISSSAACSVRRSAAISLSIWPWRSARRCWSSWLSISAAASSCGR